MTVPGTIERTEYPIPGPPTLLPRFLVHYLDLFRYLDTVDNIACPYDLDLKLTVRREFLPL